MKNIAALFLALFALTACSKKLWIHGSAVTTKPYYNVMVVVNDTIAKIGPDISSNAATKLLKDKRLIAIANRQGNFRIKVKTDDSLYFNNSYFFPQAYKVSDLLKRDTIAIKLLPYPCDTAIPCRTKATKIYAVVAKKNSLTYKPRHDCPGVLVLDGASKYEGNYTVQLSLYGGMHHNQVLTFIVYNNDVPYKNDENVLLYLADYCGNLVNLKDGYSTVYRTQNGRWAAPYQPDHKIKPELILFDEPLTFDIASLSKKDVALQYPTPYYKIENGKAIALYGYYAEDLFESKKAALPADYGLE
jgi:hypothetical protein